jgi:hypothetical protein
MALRNDPRLYSGGAVTIPQPSLNLYAQILQRQQAKADAMDQYERSRINSVNDAGLRDVDRKTLDDKLGELRSLYNSNKQKIQKGNSQEAFDYEKKFRDIKDLVAQSKDRAARHNAAMQFYNDRLKVDQRLPEDFMHELHSNDMPIGEKYVDESGEQSDYKPFDVAKWSSEPKPFTQQTYLTGFKDLKRTASQPTYEKTDNPLKQNEVTVESFDNGAKQVIAARAADKYDNSYSFSSQVQNEIKDPVRRKQLGDLFKQEYGTDATMPSDYAVAYTMEMLQPKIIKSKTIENKEAIAQMNDRLIRGRMAAQNIYTNQHIDKRTEQALADMAASDEEFDKAWAAIGTNLPSGLVKKVYEPAQDSKGHSYGAPEVTKSDDGKSFVFTNYDADGNIVKQEKKSEETLKKQYREDINTAVKRKGQIPQQKSAPKKEINRADIKIKAAAAGYSEKEYENLLRQKGIKVID